MSGSGAGGAGDPPTFDEAVRTSVLDPSGTRIRYGPTPFQVFGALLQRKRDGADPLRDYDQRLFDPVGIDPGRWTCVEGTGPGSRASPAQDGPGSRAVAEADNGRRGARDVTRAAHL